MLTRYKLNLSWVVCNREIMSSCFNPCLLNIVSGIIKSRRMSLCVCVYVKVISLKHLFTSTEGFFFFPQRSDSGAWLALLAA